MPTIDQRICVRCARRVAECAYQRQSGGTALGCAASRGHLDCVRLLLQRGAKIQTNYYVRRAMISLFGNGIGIIGIGIVYECLHRASLPADSHATQPFELSKNCF
jgi:hypothetical protein